MHNVSVYLQSSVSSSWRDLLRPSMNRYIVEKKLGSGTCTLQILW